MTDSRFMQLVDDCTAFRTTVAICTAGTLVLVVEVWNAGAGSPAAPVPQSANSRQLPTDMPAPASPSTPAPGPMPMPGPHPGGGVARTLIDTADRAVRTVRERIIRPNQPPASNP